MYQLNTGYIEKTNITNLLQRNESWNQKSVGKMFNSRSSASLNNCTETPKVTKIIYADNTQNLDLLFRSAKSRNINQKPDYLIFT